MKASIMIDTTLNRQKTRSEKCLIVETPSPFLKNRIINQKTQLQPIH